MAAFYKLDRSGWCVKIGGCLHKAVFYRSPALENYHLERKLALSGGELTNIWQVVHHQDHNYLIPPMSEHRIDYCSHRL